MISPAWASFGLGVAVVACSIVGSWWVGRYKIKQLELQRKEDKEASEKQMTSITKAISSLDICIRDSVSQVGKEIKSLLFNPNDAGRPYYRRADDCTNLVEEFEERVHCLEAKSHSHKQIKGVVQG